MHCHTFNNRLHQLLDERLCPESDTDLMRHATECNSCRELLAGQQALLTGLARLSLPLTGDDFAQRTVQRMQAESARGSSTRIAREWLWAIPLAAAAAILLAITLFWQTKPADDLSQIQGNALANNGSAELQMAAADPLLYEQRIREWVQRLPVEHWEEVDYEAVEAYAPGLRSLRISFALALDTLRRSFPGHRETPKAEGAHWQSPQPPLSQSVS